MLISVQDKPDLNLEAFVGELIFIIPAGMIPPKEIIETLYGVSDTSSEPADREKFERLRSTKYDEDRYAIQHPEKGILIVPKNIFDKGCKPIDSLPNEEIDAKAYYYVSFFSEGKFSATLLNESPVEWSVKNRVVLLQIVPITESVYEKGQSMIAEMNKEKTDADSAQKGSSATDSAVTDKGE